VHGLVSLEDWERSDHPRSSVCACRRLTIIRLLVSLKLDRARAHMTRPGLASTRSRCSARAPRMEARAEKAMSRFLLCSSPQPFLLAILCSACSRPYSCTLCSLRGDRDSCYAADYNARHLRPRTSRLPDLHVRSAGLERCSLLSPQLRVSQRLVWAPCATCSPTTSTQVVTRSNCVGAAPPTSSPSRSPVPCNQCQTTACARCLCQCIPRLSFS
jgi:hypothetical protein